MAFADPDPYFRDRRADFLGDPDRVGRRRSAVHVFTHVERGIRVLVRAFRLVYESDPADSLRDGLRAGVSDENLEYRRGRAVLPWGVRRQPRRPRPDRPRRLSILGLYSGHDAFRDGLRRALGRHSRPAESQIKRQRDHLNFDAELYRDRLEQLLPVRDVVRNGCKPDRYYGLDIVPESVEAAKTRFAGRQSCTFHLDPSEIASADYLVASGVFNIKLDASNANRIGGLCDQDRIRGVHPNGRTASPPH